jgi:hypothetical protein
MKRIAIAAVAIGLFAFVAAPALADGQPTARDIQAAMDSYFASAEQDASLVGGAGTAGYDSGFWIRGGDFLLRINLTLQARYEYFDYDNDLEGENPRRHELSGFSVPRALLKFSGTAPCSTRYYLEMDFGHMLPDQWNIQGLQYPMDQQAGWFDTMREAWIEWGCADAFNFRMGLIKTPTTRQLMVPAELQQFVDISMASSITAWLMPGYTDRNRDYGFMVHGLIGCSNEFQYMLAVTNGDGGDHQRNVLDVDTSDNLAYSARVNWTFLQGIGYTEGATRQNTCVWYGEIGIWGYYYADRDDRPHTQVGDRTLAGVDLALGYGGFSFTGAFTYASVTDAVAINDTTWSIMLVQAGYHFPGSAWEFVARWSAVTSTVEDPGGDLEPETTSIAVGVNYYLNGHGNKITIDGTFISTTGDGTENGGWYDVYCGVPLGWIADGDSYLIRLQWQLAL